MKPRIGAREPTRATGGFVWPIVLMSVQVGQKGQLYVCVCVGGGVEQPDGGALLVKNRTTCCTRTNKKL